ncbi:MAG: polysaccharide biosynthesis/export family protein [Sedimentisphaerales bacterium]
MPSLQIRIVRAFLLSTTVFFITGCFSSNPQDIQAFLKPYQTDVTTEKYILQPPDEVEVHCARIPELNLQRMQIRPDGKLSFEILGEFQAAGKTPEEVADIIKQKASTLYALVGDQPIEVRVVAFKSKVFYVLGQVDQPGSKVYTGRDSVMSAISDARPNPMAWLGRIQVIRPSGDEKVKAKIFEVDFDRMAAHGELGKNVLLQEGDIIYVPPTIMASVGKTVQEILAPITSTATTITVVQRAVVGPSTTQSGP